MATQGPPFCDKISVFPCLFPTETETETELKKTRKSTETETETEFRTALIPKLFSGTVPRDLTILHHSILSYQTGLN